MPENGNSTTIPDNLDGLYRDSRSHAPVLVWNYGVKGLLRRGETSVLYGPPNCGKSALVCYIGHRITSGLPCFGAPVQKGIVVHVGAEAPDSILDRMKAYPSDDEGAAPYIVRMGAVDLSDSTEVESFIHDLKQIHRLVGAADLPHATRNGRKGAGTIPTWRPGRLASLRLGLFMHRSGRHPLAGAPAPPPSSR